MRTYPDPALASNAVGRPSWAALPSLFASVAIQNSEELLVSLIDWLRERDGEPCGEDQSNDRRDHGCVQGSP